MEKQIPMIALQCSTLADFPMPEAQQPITVINLTIYFSYPLKDLVEL